MSAWVRLKRGDDWGFYYYALEPHDEHGMASARRGIKVSPGEPVKVRWPDGSVEDTVIATERYQHNVSDMGHEYPVSGHKVGVKLVAHGVAWFVEITDVDVPRDWVESRQPTPGKP